MTNVKFLKVNGEELEDLLEKYEISAFPTFALFKKGELFETKSGKMNENDLKNFIKSNL